MRAVAGICSADAVHLLAACSGGILASLTAAVLADRSRAAAGAADDNPRLASLTLLVTMLDQARTDADGMAAVAGACGRVAAPEREQRAQHHRGDARTLRRGRDGSGNRHTGIVVRGRSTAWRNSFTQLWPLGALRLQRSN